MPVRGSVPEQKAGRPAPWSACMEAKLNSEASGTSMRSLSSAIDHPAPCDLGPRRS
jgi:hypothetical protein